MGERYLIDTCSVIHTLNATYSADALNFMMEVLENGPIISFITQIELLVAKPSGYEEIKIRDKFVDDAQIEYVNEDIIKEAIYIRSMVKIALPDSIIAATAKHFDYTLISCNESDFKKVTSLGVKYLNPNTDF